MFGQGCVPLDVPDDVVPEFVLDDVVVAANEAKPYATSAPIAKIAITAMRTSDFLLGNDLLFGTVAVPKSNSHFHLRRSYIIILADLISNFQEASSINNQLKQVLNKFHLHQVAFRSLFDLDLC
jgi:hypothetical protein